MAQKKQIKLSGLKVTITRTLGENLVQTILELTTRAQHRVETATTSKEAMDAAIDLMGRYVRVLDDTAQISPTSAEALEAAYAKFWQQTKHFYDKWLEKEPDFRAPTRFWWRFAFADVFRSADVFGKKKANNFFIGQKWGPLATYLDPTHRLAEGEEIQTIEIHNRDLEPEDFMSWEDFLSADPKREGMAA